MLFLATLLLEVLLPEPLEPHVGHDAEGRRVTDDAKFAIEEIAICPNPYCTDRPRSEGSKRNPIMGGIEQTMGSLSR